jgi:WD40 repeat protein
MDGGRTICALDNANLQTVRFWDTSTGRLIGEVDLSQAPPRSDPRPIAARSAAVIATPHMPPDGKVRLWRLGSKSGPIEFPAEIGNESREVLALSPDGSNLAVTFRDDGGSIRIFSSAKPEHPVARLPTGFRRLIDPAALEFSASGRLLFVTREIWNVASGERVWSCPEDDHFAGAGLPLLRGVLFDDERHVLVMQYGHWQLWDTATDRKLATLHVLPGGEWVFINHQSGHWNGSDLAFPYLRCLYRPERRPAEWLTPNKYEERTGGKWKNDPQKAGLGRRP